MIDHMHSLSLFDCQHRHLGTVVLDREEGLWQSGPFEPFPEFATVEQLFRDWMESANQQMFSHVDELDAKIARLGLRLVSDRGEVLPGVQSIQIGEGRLSIRLETMPSSVALNGAPHANSKVSHPAAS